jgi:hypothetical protein
MFDRCEFYLELGFWGDCMQGEYLQDEIYSIPCLHFRFCEAEMFIHIPDLSWLHDIPDDQ